MAHKTLVGGTEYNITGGKALKDGTRYKVTGGTTLIGGSAYVMKFNNYNAVFSDNSWEQILDACEKNKVPDTWVVGSLAPMTIRGNTNYVEIIGKNHDTYTGGGTAPLTFQLHCVHPVTQAMNSSNTNNTSWESCSARTMLANLIADSEVPSDGFKFVDKDTSAGANSPSIITSSDQMFYLSVIEITGSAGTTSFTGEGTQYDKYKNALTSARLKTTFNNMGTSDYVQWWTRSPVYGNTNRFCFVDVDGEIGTALATATRYYAPAFCL